MRANAPFAPSSSFAGRGAAECRQRRRLEALQTAATTVRPGTHDLDLLTEILLKAGHPLTTAVHSISLHDTPVYAVDDGRTLVCLADPLTPDVLHAMMTRSPRTILCLDQAFRGDDALRTNTLCALRSHGVEHFLTV